MFLSWPFPSCRNTLGYGSRWHLLCLNSTGDKVKERQAELAITGAAMVTKPGSTESHSRPNHSRQNCWQAS